MIQLTAEKRKNKDYLTSLLGQPSPKNFPYFPETWPVASHVFSSMNHKTQKQFITHSDTKEFLQEHFQRDV